MYSQDVAFSACRDRTETTIRHVRAQGDALCLTCHGPKSLYSPHLAEGAVCHCRRVCCARLHGSTAYRPLMATTLRKGRDASHRLQLSQMTSPKTSESSKTTLHRPTGAMSQVACCHGQTDGRAGHDAGAAPAKSSTEGHDDRIGKIGKILGASRTPQRAILSFVRSQKSREHALMTTLRTLSSDSKLSSDLV